MTAKNFAISYVTTAVIFLALDAVWLSTMATRLYKPQLGSMMTENFVVFPALAFYVLYVAGMVVFAVSPAMASGRWATALGYGAMLGLVAYATYDLTNQSTLKNWPWIVTIADLCWGTFATAVAAALSSLASRWLVEKFA
jgi:uncharacterized membrane protein